MILRRLVPAALCTLCVGSFLALTPDAPAAEVTAEVSEKTDRVTVKIDGNLFAEYLTRSGTKPIVWPIIGPTGKPMTRSWPMGEKGSVEMADHVHQRSFWFTHGDVNGTDFWAEEGKPVGTIKHREFVQVQGGPEAVVITQNDWIAADGKRVCEDERTLTFGTDGENRYIDFDITIKAPDGPVTFGDTKEGSFGIRMAATLQPDSKLGGRLVNSEGKTNADAWGKPAKWVDYSGPIDNETVGIALMNHPGSFRYPTHWHARTYGLCSANPFGLKEFDPSSQGGSYTIAQGESITLRYRMWMHKGDTEQANVAEAFEAYEKKK
jgi:hypothetical protein